MTKEINPAKVKAEDKNQETLSEGHFLPQISQQNIMEDHQMHKVK
jgi:hypothetical protein